MKDQNVGIAFKLIELAQHWKCQSYLGLSFPDLRQFSQWWVQVVLKISS